MTKRLYILLISVFLFASCLNTVPEAPPRQPILDLTVPVVKLAVGEVSSCGAAADSADPKQLFDELFCDNVLHRFLVKISRSEWDGISEDMLAYAKKYPVKPYYDGDGRQYRNGDYRKADFYYVRPDGEEIFIREVGIRTRGNESRKLPEADGSYRKTHFKIKFDETFALAKGTEEYKSRNDRRFAGMKALDFKWSRYATWDQYTNMTKINELFSYELLSRIGINAPRMSMASLKFEIDGEEVDYGLYGIVEHVDKTFLKRRFGKDDEGDLYKCLYLDPGGGAFLNTQSVRGRNVGVKDFDSNYRPIYDLKTNEKKSDHAQLLAFVQNLNEKQGEEFTMWINENFEVDSFLRYLAMGIFINNLDDYRFLANNYYLYFHENGKAEYIPYDFDISLGTAWHGDMNYNDFINQDIFNTVDITATLVSNSSRPLVDKILAVDKFRQTYLQYLRACIEPENGLFLFSKYRDKFELVSGMYGDKCGNDTADQDPIGLKGYEEKYFHDKTRNVLDQLGMDYKGFELK